LSEANAMRGLFFAGAALALLSALLAWRWLDEPTEKVERHRLSFVDLHWRVERLRYLPMRLLYFLDLRNHHGHPHRYPPALHILVIGVKEPDIVCIGCEKSFCHI
ncbi:MAG: hypothetical protein AABZ62_06915, partial [Planctomycetota bacterium]